MSKKKNTLKDLDDFLKQQAAMLVAPEQLGTKSEESSTVVEPQPVAQTDAVIEKAITLEAFSLSSEKILLDLQALAKQNGKPVQQQLYDFIIEVAGNQNSATAENTMLINTALYLKSGPQWKDAVRAYWKDKA